MRLKKATALVVAAGLLLTMGAGAANESTEDINEIEKATIMNTDENNAYVMFGNPIEENMMEFVDGMEQGITDPNDPLYSEKVSFLGIDGRKVYNANYVYLRLDEEFYEPEDSEFIVSISYYDFGPDPGTFHLEYNSSDDSSGEENLMKRVSLKKTGLVQKWYTVKVYISDAKFVHGMPYESDLRLVSNAYNAFAKVEITNVSKAKRDPSIKLGTVSSAKAENLHKLGLYDGISEEEYQPGLEETITREEAVMLMLKALGLEKEVTNENAVCSFSDVSEEAKPYVGYAEAHGIVKGTADGVFDAQRNVTKRELITFYFRALGYTDEEGIYENAEEMAMAEGLIEGNDLIFNVDTDATRDNFAAIAFNALIMKDKDLGMLVMSDMMNRGLFDEDDVNATGDDRLVAQIYEQPKKMPYKTIIDPTTGRTIHLLTINGNNAIRPYVTAQHWDVTGTKFVVGEAKTNALYLYDTVKQEIQMLDYGSVGGDAGAVITPENMMFYHKPNGEVWQMDLNTLEKRKVADMPSYASGLSVLSATNDGKYVSGYWMETRSELDYFNGVARHRIVPRLNVETGEWDSTSLHHEFNDIPEFPELGHPLINPEYENLALFCHEGTTEYIPDRIWLGNFDTGETKNLFLQAERPDGMTGETSGHELWTQDGEEVFFVKYTRKENLGQSGVVRVDKDGNNREYINGDHPYWHCYPSPDKLWVCADTQIGGNRAEVVLINVKTYESHMLANFYYPNKPHPWQPHPIMSQDGKKVSWQMADPDNTEVLGTAWMDLSDIIDTPIETLSDTISNTADYVSYKGAINEVIKTEYNGEACYRVPAEKDMYVNINDDITTDTNGDISIRLTYLDIGRQPMNLHYTTGLVDKSDYANREDANIQIERHNTNQWKTVDIRLTGANLGNAGKYRTDFCIGGLYSDAYIKNVEIIK